MKVIYIGATLLNLFKMGDLELEYASGDLVPPEYTSLYTEKDGKYVLTGVKGIKTEADITRLQSALNKERSDHTATKQKYSFLGGQDLAVVQTRLDKYEELELLAKTPGTDDTKINELVETRIKSRLIPVERERDQLKNQVGELTTEVTTFKQKETRNTIVGAVRKAAAVAKVRDSAIEDVEMYAERLFTIDEHSGNIVTKDGVGVTPGVDPTVWLSEVLTSKPHWFPDSVGGGANGNRGNQGGAINPYSYDNWSITEQMRLYKENPTRAQQFAKACGVDPLNPKRPEPRK